MRKAIVSLVIVSSVSLGGCMALDKMTPEQRDAVATTVEGAGAAAPVIGAAGGPIGVVAGSALGAALMALGALLRNYKPKVKEPTE